MPIEGLSNKSTERRRKTVTSWKWQNTRLANQIDPENWWYLEQSINKHWWGRDMTLNRHRKLQMKRVYDYHLEVYAEWFIPFCREQVFGWIAATYNVLHDQWMTSMWSKHVSLHLLPPPLHHPLIWRWQEWTICWQPNHWLTDGLTGKPTDRQTDKMKVPRPTCATPKESDLSTFRQKSSSGM